MARLRGTDSRDVIRGTDSRDEIFGYGGNDDLYGYGGNDDIYGGAGSDLMYGGAGHDYLSGGTGNDEIYGGTGDDDIYGGSGHDDLFGGSGSDYIYGGSGDDDIVGGTGQDFLTGGFGQDAFIYTSNADSRAGYYNRDVITDFILDEDIIDLSGVDARTDLAGNQQFFWDGYRSNPNSTAAGSVSYRYVDGNTVISANTDRDSTIEFQIELEGTCPLKSFDFIL